MEYLMPSGYGKAEYTEKRSRFIGQVWPVTSEEEARSLIARAKAQHHDARHNCWCCLIRGEDGSAAAVRYADDGEPQGTVGLPMLEVFRRGGVENVLCVVTRYFGGILLGAGGLSRAYAHTAKLALEAAGVAEMRSRTAMEIVCPYGLLERVKNEIGRCGGVLEQAEYGADVKISAVFDDEQAQAFAQRLSDMSSGAVKSRVAGRKYAAIKSRRS